MFFEQYEVEPCDRRRSLLDHGARRAGEVRRRARREVAGRQPGARRARGAPRRPRVARRRRVLDRRHLALRLHARGRGGRLRSRRSTRRCRRGSPGSPPARGTSRSRHRRTRRRCPSGGDGLARPAATLRRRAPGVCNSLPPRARRRTSLATIRRLGCVQLDSISTVARAHRLTLTSRIGAYPRGGGLAAPAERPRLRVLGARGLPRPDRGLPPLQAADDPPARAALVGPQARPRPEGEGRSARGAARARSAADALLRGRGRQRHVELEAGEADPRGSVRRRRGRGRRPGRLPAPVRAARAGDSAGVPGRAGTVRGGVRARIRAPSGRGPRRADRVGHRRALPLPGRDQGDAAGRRLARGGGAGPPGRRGRRRRPGRRRRRRRRSTARPPAASSSARSTTWSGTGLSSSACSASAM